MEAHIVMVSVLIYMYKHDKVHCALITAKIMVAPIKVTTIQRLELTAAVASITASVMLKDELGLTHIEYFWTDSKTVLGYINNEARQFQTFASNRVKKIRFNSSPQQWRCFLRAKSCGFGLQRFKCS